jgi:hypothetical protein
MFIASITYHCLLRSVGAQGRLSNISLLWSEEIL